MIPAPPTLPFPGPNGSNPNAAVHTPPPDDREPKTRRHLDLWDRAKILVILTVLFFMSAAIKHGDVPIMSWSDAIRDTLRAKSWLLWLAIVEAVRQFHYIVSEHSPAYHGFWMKHVWGAWERQASKLNPWMRFRLGRLFRVLCWGSLLMLGLAALWGMSFFEAIAQAPSRLWSNPFGSGGLPWFFQLFLTLGLGVGQFAAIFWFMSRGGVDSYMPQEIKTRFSDVWGQDKVLAKVKENIVFLDRPQEIEGKGGHVPGGILLWGPPGTGKTLMAEAVAGETGRPYVFVDPGAFQNMFFGVGILKVKSLFRKLRKLALRYGGVIVFFDEADSLGSRSTSTGLPQPGKSRMSFEAPFYCNGLHYVSHDTAQRVTADLHAATPAPEPPSGIRGVVATGMMGGGGMGTLQALLSELSGLKKPRGFVSRRLRQFLTMPPRKPPKYRLLVMMATNLPEALDAALLRPGRIDRIYKVDFPTLEGRKRTFEGYLDKVKHQITPEQVERISLMSPRASGAVVKDMVNEALIIAMRNGRDAVVWQDLLEAKQLKTHGMADDVHPMALERHSVALHEASHAVAMYRLKRREMIDIATIEPRGPIGGFVSPVPLEEPGFPWRYLQEDEVMTFLASLAGERYFYEGDNSVGVGGDLRASTSIVMGMLGYAGMGRTIASHSVLGAADADPIKNDLGRQVEERLRSLLERAHALITGNKRYVMAIAHALEKYKTVSGEDIDAIFSGGKGPIVDGAWYQTDQFVRAYEAYHACALVAHRTQGKLLEPLPEAPQFAGAIATTSTPLPPPPPPALNGAHP
jgi:cell division protease FtsH